MELLSLRAPKPSSIPCIGNTWSAGLEDLCPGKMLKTNSFSRLRAKWPALLNHLKPRQEGNRDVTCIASCHGQLEDIRPKITSPSNVLFSSTRRNTNTNTAFHVGLRETIVLNNDSSTCSFRLKIPMADRNLVPSQYYLSSTQLT